MEQGSVTAPVFIWDHAITSSVARLKKPVGTPRTQSIKFLPALPCWSKAATLFAHAKAHTQASARRRPCPISWGMMTGYAFPLQELNHAGSRFMLASACRHLPA